MQANELLEMLSANGVEPLDNQIVSNQMSGGIDAASLQGDLVPSVIDGAFQDALPDATPEALEANLSHDDLPSFDFSNTHLEI